MPITVLTHPPAGGVRTPVPPLVIAHRGASLGWPENTIPAFVAGIDQGADMIEVDVHMSADGELVVVHDITFDRTTDVRTVFPDRADTHVSQMTAAEIARLDAGSWKHEAFVGLQVPTLAEVLALVHTTRTGLLLEVKHPELYPGIAEAIVAACDNVPDYLDRSLAAGLLVVQSADWGFVREFHELAPEVPVGLLGRPTPEQLRDFAAWVDQINPEYADADAEYLTLIHELGMSSLVWTIDAVPDMETAIENGADGIITNVPDVLVEVVEEL